MSEPLPTAPAPRPRTRRLLGRRGLFALLLLGLLGLGGWLLGRLRLVEYHLREARIAAECGNNLRAQVQLERCLRLEPQEPRALLLAARVARRVGSFDLAAGWLDRYQDLRGAGEELVLERVLLRAA